MQHLQFRSADGRIYPVDLPAPMAGLESAYLFAFHKSGSTLMDNMVREYCQYFGIPTFSLFNAAFDSGISTRAIMADAAVCLKESGRIYTGFRHYPSFDLDLAGARTLLLVRDPRDMLVSMYYSMTRSHVIPKNHQQLKANRRKAVQMDIDDFTLSKVRGYLNNFSTYQEKLPEDTLKTYRYEDVIYAKDKWLADMVDLLGLPYKREQVRKTAAKFDVFPAHEDQSRHIRQVHPGNYKTRLKPATIDALNIKLEKFLQFYNYI